MTDYDNLLKLVKDRRSIRRFKPDPVPDDFIDKIIEVARWAPSGANSQPWQFLVVRKQELKDSIVDIIADQNKLVNKMEVAREPELRFVSAPAGWARAPVFIFLLGDPRNNEAYPIYVTLEHGHETLVSGLASAFLYMTLAVATLGLGGQWVTSVSIPYAQSMIKSLLDIPRGMEIYDMLAVGYPDMEPKPRLMREKQDLVHHDLYDKARYPTDQQVKDFILSLNQWKMRK